MSINIVAYIVDGRKYRLYIMNSFIYIIFLSPFEIIASIILFKFKIKFLVLGMDKTLMLQ
jgi:hypothetical protein